MKKIDDNLKVESNNSIKLKIQREKVYFSGNVKKKKKKLFSYTQERGLIITNNTFNNMKGNEIKRRVKLENIKAITVSDKSDEFIIHGNQNEYDYLYLSSDKKTIVKHLELRYYEKTHIDLLFCLKSSKELQNFVVNKKERKENPNLFKIKQNELTSIRKYLNLKIGKKEEKVEKQNKEEIKIKKVSKENEINCIYNKQSDEINLLFDFNIDIT